MNGYPGSKGQAGTPQRIIGQMPPHGTYVEAFYGSGEIYQRKKAARSSFLIDTNPACLSAIVQTDSVRPLLGRFLDLLPHIPLSPDSLIYADPPYPHDTRGNRLLYGAHEMTADDHS